MPHDIVEAFKSTLEVALNCDLALFVADASADYRLQFSTTAQTLDELGFNKKVIKVLNKCDIAENLSSLPPDCVLISARTGNGIPALKEKIKAQFEERYLTLDLSIGFKELGEYESLKNLVKELDKTYTDEGLNCKVRVEKMHADKFSRFIRVG